MFAIREGFLKPTGTESAPIEELAAEAIEHGVRGCARRFGNRFQFRGVLGMVLAVGELIALGWLIDTGGLNQATLAGRWLQYAPQVAQVAVAAATTWLLLSGPAIWRLLGTVTTQRSRSLDVALFAMHVALFAAFAVVGHVLLGSHVTVAAESELALHAPSSTWCAVWCSIGIAAGFAGAAWTLPPAGWRRIALEFRSSHLAALSAGVVAWYVGELAEQGWRPLAELTFRMVSGILNCLYDDIVVVPSILQVGTERFSVTIDPSCSGYAGLGLMTVFLTMFLLAFRQRLKFPQAFVLLPFGLLAVWLLNSARIAALIAIGTHGAPDVALGGFHSQAGWIAFNLVALGLAAAALQVPWFTTDRDAAPASTRNRVRSESIFNDPTAAHLGPFLGVLLVGMVGGAATPEGQSLSFAWHVVRIAVGAALIWLLRPGRSGQLWRASWPAIAVGTGVYAIWLALLPSASTAATSSPFPADWSTLSAGIAVGVRLLGYVIVTPLVEELAFRGYVLRRVMAVEFDSVRLRPAPWVGLAVSAALFGAFHGSHWLAGIAAGAAYGWLYVRRGSLGDSVVAHATTNGLLAVHALWTGNWAAWS